LTGAVVIRLELWYVREGKSALTRRERRFICSSAKRWLVVPPVGFARDPDGRNTLVGGDRLRSLAFLTSR
jgi:hypothetical protein